MKSKDAIQTVSIVLSFVGGALLVYAFFQLFLVPVYFDFSSGPFQCGDSGIISGFERSSELECLNGAWERVSSTSLWICIGGGMLVANHFLRRDVLKKAE